jgi:hypothetical protein
MIFNQLNLFLFYPFCIPLRGSFDRLTHNINIIIKKKKQANENCIRYTLK